MLVHPAVCFTTAFHHIKTRGEFDFCGLHLIVNLVGPYRERETDRNKRQRERDFTKRTDYISPSPHMPDYVTTKCPRD